MNRIEFLPRRLEYLFSFDLDLAESRGRKQGLAGTQVMRSAAARHTADSNSLVYNALGDTVVAGEPAITGYVDFSQDSIALPPGREFGEISGRLVIRTSDS